MAGNTLGKGIATGDVAEDYYQIGHTILSSFNKYRPPLDLFVFDEKVGLLIPFFFKGGRLTNERVEELAKHCNEGNLFVARSDHPIYSEHIAKQLDLILQDENLKEQEIVSICLRALTDRLTEFFEQPVKALYVKLESDILVLTEYLWQDAKRLTLFLTSLWVGKDTLAKHSLNSLFIGLYLFLETQKKEHVLTRKEFNQATLALILHDVGMAKIPVLLLEKETSLNSDDKSKVEQHVLTGNGIMRKLGQTFSFMEQAILEHHERLDGSGYPQHAKELSTFGKIVAVADAFSAIIASKPYKKNPKDFVGAASELALDASHFDRVYTSKLVSGAMASTFGGGSE